jgi:DNA-binding XRE family transcriptional regulator
MEFNEKLQALRKQKDLTQEELAIALCVSRAAVSKWESGRGYPSIDTLKEIATFFNLTIDELLSSDELLGISPKDYKEYDKQKSAWLKFSILDICSLIMLFIPLFAQNLSGEIQNVSLLFLNEISLYLKIVFWVIVSITVLYGLLSLILRKRYLYISVIKRQNLISLILSIIGVLLFVVAKQPYAAVYCFILLGVKVFFLVKNKRH